MSQVPPSSFPMHAAQSGNHSYPPPPPVAGYPVPPGAYGMQPARRSGAAVASLVFGMLLCVPFVTGLLAIITGMVGLGATRAGGRTGRGLATVGLILGVLNLVTWGAATPKMIAWGKGAYSQVTAQNDIARQFFRDLGGDDVAAAAAKCHSTMPREALEQGAKTLQSWGALQDVTVSSVNVQSSTSTGDSWLIQGTAKYASGDRKFNVEFGKENGKWVIVEYNLKP